MSEPTAKQIEAREAVDRLGSIAEAARELGIERSTVAQRLRGHAAHALKGHRAPVAPMPSNDPTKPGVPDGFLLKQVTTQYGANGVRGHSVKARAGSTDVEPIPAGLELVGISRNTDSNGNIISNWDLYRKDRSANNQEMLEAALQRAFAEWDGKAPPVAGPTHSDASKLVVYPVPDLHFGMYSWGKETGSDYDIKIATDTMLHKFAQLVDRSDYAETGILLGLGDYFHANDHTAATPKSGHRLDVDARWPKVYDAGARLAVAMVDMVARKHRRAVVRFLKGNHDEDAADTLGVALNLFYSNEPRIEVDRSPSLFWYYRHGSTLLGATHGHTCKPVQMAGALAVDRAQDWGLSKHRYFFYGHVHHKTADKVNGVLVESFDALCPMDAFNAGSGHRSGRSMQSICFDLDDGEHGRHIVNL